MSSQLHYFCSASGATTTALPFDLNEVIGDWAALRSPLVKNRPEEFSRSEWAYLIAELEPKQLTRYFIESFGLRTQSAHAGSQRLLRPRGTVAVWLPNNVSLLGPISVLALSLTGNRLLLKSGSSSVDLTGAFLRAVLSHLRPGTLRSLLESRVVHESFDRQDARNIEWAAKADVRIVFGSDRAAAEIHGGRPENQAISISFTDRSSVVWMEPSACTDETLISLIRVFSVYGIAGCSSPRAIVLLNATPEQAKEVQGRLLALWPQAVRERPVPHVASANYLTWQLARAAGWDAERTSLNASVVATGERNLPRVEGNMFLPVFGATIEEALNHLPENVQTVGYSLTAPIGPIWTALLARTQVKRFVPISKMHQFGPVWDGRAYWRECFEEVDIQA